MSILRQLVDMYSSVQKLRVGLDNRLSALERNEDTARQLDKERLQRWRNNFLTVEHELAQEFELELSLHPAWPWLSQVRGIGPVLGAKLLGLIGDIRRAPTISSLWRFAGQDPTADRLVKGKRAKFNRRLKTTCYLGGCSFLRTNSPYLRVFEEALEYYQRERPDWNEAHCRNAARRKMVKVFLSHLWLKWREAEGLPVSKPYILEQPGHSRFLSPDDFVEPSREKQ